MIDSYRCTASLVLYNNPLWMLRDVLQCLIPSVFVTIVDNSPTSALQSVLSGMEMVTYHHADQNLGYGKGHNLALSLSPPSDCHLIINPDICFESPVLVQMLDFMDQNSDIGMLSPQFLNGDGSRQYLNRRNPTVLDLVLRRLPDSLLIQRMRERISDHEMRAASGVEAYDAESLSGAFMLCRRDTLERAGGFDPRYFMYFEDFDLCRSLRGQGFRTVCYPAVSVEHHWERASSREIRMTLAHIQSMILFFNKWGWKWY